MTTTKEHEFKVGDVLHILKHYDSPDLVLEHGDVVKIEHVDSGWWNISITQNSGRQRLNMVSGTDLRAMLPVSKLIPSTVQERMMTTPTGSNFANFANIAPTIQPKVKAPKRPTGGRVVIEPPRKLVIPWLVRFQSAIGLFTGCTPDEEICERWFNGDDESLQDWVNREACGNGEMFQGIVIIESAEILADQPSGDQEKYPDRPTHLYPPHRRPDKVIEPESLSTFLTAAQELAELEEPADAGAW